GKTQRDIYSLSIVDQVLAHLQAGGSQRHLDADVVGNGGQLFAFDQHGFVIGGGDLGAYRTIDDTTDFRDRFDEITTGLVDQRRVGGYPVEQIQIGEFADIIHVCGIDKKFHFLIL